MAAVAKDIVTRRAVAGTIKLTVLAGKASPGPPVSPALGPYRLNMMAFCKDFNARTQKYKPDTPMAVKITAYMDHSFEFTFKSPSVSCSAGLENVKAGSLSFLRFRSGPLLVSWYIKKAAGVDKGSTRPGHLTVTTLSVRHVYEIAKVKQTDPFCQYMPLESICKSIIGTANSMGIKIVQDLE